MAYGLIENKEWGTLPPNKSWKLCKLIMGTISEWLDRRENWWLGPMPYQSCWSVGRCSHRFEVAATFGIFLLSFFSSFLPVSDIFQSLVFLLHLAQASSFLRRWSREWAHPPTIAEEAERDSEGLPSFNHSYCKNPSTSCSCRPD